MNGTPPSPWHPREGKRFFLLWVAGILVEATLVKLMMFSIQFAGSGPALGRSQLFVVYAVVGLAAGAWQAWLLFPRGWRMLVWGLMPLLYYGLTSFSAIPVRWVSAFYLLLLLVGGFQCLLLIGVRRRPWLWFLAIVGECLVSLAINSFITFMGTGVFDRLAAFLPGVSGMHILLAASSGAWLLANIGSAAVLAWWIPPIRHEEEAS